MRHLAAFVPNVLGFSPGQRARIEMWTGHLEAAGWTVSFHIFEDDRLHEVLYKPGGAGRKATRLLAAYGRHLARTVRVADADAYYLYREAALVGPAVLERVLARRAAPLVYDVDDPVWLPYRSETNGWLTSLKFLGKSRSLFKMSDRVIAINQLIGDYAARFNPAVTVIPNCIDTDRYKPADRPANQRVRLGWIGSHSTVANMATIADPLARVQRDTGAEVRVIGAGALELPGVDLDFRDWSAATEVDLLRECDVGLVPLRDEISWNHWKFFFKVIQYMALGLPVVADRLGSNAEVIDDGVNGFLVETDDEWYDRLCQLVRDPDLRRAMGAAARATVVERYSLDVQVPRVVALFDELVPG